MKQKTFKLPKSKKVTVDDLLGQDDVNKVLNEVIKVKKDITGIIIIYENDEGWVKWKAAGFNSDEMVGTLEKVKVLEITTDYGCACNDGE